MTKVTLPTKEEGNKNGIYKKEWKRNAIMLGDCNYMLDVRKVFSNYWRTSVCNSYRYDADIIYKG